MTATRVSNTSPVLKPHPLVRLTDEAPERLEVALRRAAFSMIRRRLGGWIARRLSALILMADGWRRMAVRP